MQDNDVKAFKTRLRYYSWLLSYIERLKDDIEVVEYEMQGVKGLRYDREPGGSSTEEQKFDKYLNLSNKLESKRNKLSVYQFERSEIEDTLNQLDDISKDIAISVFVKGKSYESLTSKYYLSVSGLKKKLERDVKKILYPPGKK